MIYFDNNATTRVLPEVLAAMLPYWSDLFYNPTSLAADICGIRRSLDLAAEQLANLLNTSPEEVTLTSGATEANNWVLQSITSEWLRKSGCCHILISAIEHPSVIETALEINKRDPGVIVEIIPVNHQGIIELDALRQMLRPETALVSVMFANNETGVIQPIHKTSQIVKEGAPQCLFHTDATQAIGKIMVDLEYLECVDLLSLSAHKFHGPKGIGALFIRQKTLLESWMHGGSQQRDRRAGTENPALAAGLAKAIIQLGFRQDIENQADRVAELRDRLENGILAIDPEIQILGSGSPRLPNTLLVIFPRSEGEMLVHRLLDHGIVASTGAACSNGSDRPSHVVTSMGVSFAIARNALRLSLSRDTTVKDIDECIECLRCILIAD